METGKQYPNGFESWLDTFFHITCEIQSYFDENWKKNIPSLVRQTQGMHGHIGLKDLASELTDEFEALHPTTDWEEYDFYETLEAFFKEKNEVV